MAGKKPSPFAAELQQELGAVSTARGGIDSAALATYLMSPEARHGLTGPLATAAADIAEEQIDEWQKRGLLNVTAPGEIVVPGISNGAAFQAQGLVREIERHYGALPAVRVDMLVTGLVSNLPDARERIASRAK